jgi:hypothetical protein
VLARQEAGKVASSTTVSVTSLKLQISERYSKAKERWNKNPAHHGKDSIAPPRPKKSCLDGAKNGIARVASQIRSGHWKSAVYLERIRKRDDDRCGYCRHKNGQKMTRSHVLLHCSSDRLASARQEAWESIRRTSVCHLPVHDGRDVSSISLSCRV